MTVQARPPGCRWYAGKPVVLQFETRPALSLLTSRQALSPACHRCKATQDFIDSAPSCTGYASLQAQGQHRQELSAFSAPQIVLEQSRLDAGARESFSHFSWHELLRSSAYCELRRTRTILAYLSGASGDVTQGTRERRSKFASLKWKAYCQYHFHLPMCIDFKYAVVIRRAARGWQSFAHVYVKQGLFGAPASLHQSPTIAGTTKEWHLHGCHSLVVVE